jgi:hypothetical protein
LRVLCSWCISLAFAVLPERVPELQGWSVVLQ